MHRTRSHVVLLAAALFAAGCSGDESPTGPAGPNFVTEAFTGTLTLNGAKTHPFTVTATGSMTAQIINLEPDPQNPVGISLGTWNGSICQIVLANDVAVQGGIVLGATQTAGDFCVRIYDAAGTVVREQSYVIHVTAPQTAE